MNILKKLTEWQNVGLLTAEQRSAIVTYEDAQPSAAKFLWRYGLLGLGLLAILIGCIAIVASNWNIIPAFAKLGLHLVLNMGVAGYLYREWSQGRAQTWRFEAVLLLKSVLVITLMALWGQILQTQAPLGDTLLLWWVLITPMLVIFGRYRASFIVWIILSIHVLFMMFYNKLHVFEFLAILLTAVSLTLITGPTLVSWQRKISWPSDMRQIALLTLVALANYMVFACNDAPFYIDPDLTDLPWFVVHGRELAFAASLVVAYLLSVMRFKTLSPPDILQRSDSDVRFVFLHLILMLVLCFMPQWFGWFMLYWLGIGYIGLRRNNRKIVSIAMGFLAIRILVFYFEITHSLMTTGILMMISGLGVLYLVKTYPRWRAAILSVTGGTR